MTFVVCTDAGLSSVANRRFNSIEGRAFITTQSVKKSKDYLKKWALDPAGWKLDSKDKKAADKTYHLDQVIGFYSSKERTPKERLILADKVFYKECWINEDNLEQRLIVTFSLKYRDYQYVPAYQWTDLTDSMHDAFGFRTDYQIVSNTNFKKI